MATLGHIVTGAAVKVSVPTRTEGVSEARIIRAGNILPKGVDRASVDWMVRHGLVEPIEAIADVVTADDVVAGAIVASEDTSEGTSEDPAVDPVEDTPETEAEDIPAEEDTDVFNPGDHTAEAVIAYLEELSVAGENEEVAHILEVEATGKNRKTIRDWAE